MVLLPGSFMELNQRQAQEEEVANGQFPGLSVVEVGRNQHTFTFICFLYLVSIFNII